MVLPRAGLDELKVVPVLPEGTGSRGLQECCVDGNMNMVPFYPEWLLQDA
ncbi:hypothetical protein [Deinococcus roseus]|uniref:Uncharacterized protein n=1 Tax=Deinococcus roseus TaxID=392414 RepID=A0ABQ2D9L1_9DEIO|nr:hypothetical protein [Deinococcus roseus]GGJ48234.1 hypothetical protein GCM10008938_37810 [Deinococcus roseus]